MEAHRTLMNAQRTRLVASWADRRVNGTWMLGVPWVLEEIVSRYRRSCRVHLLPFPSAVLGWPPFRGTEVKHLSC